MARHCHGHRDPQDWVRQEADTPLDLPDSTPERDRLVQAVEACLTVLHLVAEDNAAKILCMLGTAVEATLNDIEDGAARWDATVEFLETLSTRMGFEVNRDER